MLASILIRHSPSDSLITFFITSFHTEFEPSSRFFIIRLRLLLFMPACHPSFHRRPDLHPFNGSPIRADTPELRSFISIIA